MSVLPLSRLQGWSLADRTLDLRGRMLLDRNGQPLGTITELGVSTITDLVETVILENGRAFPISRIRLERDSVSLS